VRPSASIPPLAEPTQFGCAAVAPATVLQSTVYAADSVGDVRNNSCAVRWRLVNATLVCVASAVVQPTSANGVALVAADVLADGASACATTDIVITPAQLACAAIGNPVTVTVTAMQQRCTTTVVLDDPRGFCVTRDGVGRPTTRAPSGTLFLGQDSATTTLTWWMWWLIVSAVVFTILFAALIFCIVRRRQLDREEQHSHAEFKSARESAESPSTRERVNQQLGAAESPSPSSSRTYASTSNLLSSEYADVAGSKSTDYSTMPSKQLTDYSGMPSKETADYGAAGTTATDYGGMPPKSKSNYGGIGE
jgi:hypothetical protein